MKAQGLFFAQSSFRTLFFASDGVVTAFGGGARFPLESAGAASRDGTDSSRCASTAVSSGEAVVGAKRGAASVLVFAATDVFRRPEFGLSAAQTLRNSTLRTRFMV